MTERPKNDDLDPDKSLTGFEMEILGREDVINIRKYMLASYEKLRELKLDGKGRNLKSLPEDVRNELMDKFGVRHLLKRNEPNQEEQENEN